MQKKFPAVIAHPGLRSESNCCAFALARQEFAGGKYGGSFRQKAIEGYFCMVKDYGVCVSNITHC